MQLISPELAKSFENFLWILGGFFLIILALVFAFKVVLPWLTARRRIQRSFLRGEEWRDDQDLLQWLQKMNPTEFEEYIAQLFRSLGYTAHTVGQTGDHGVDVEIKKDGIIHLVQCKRYSQGNKVGEPEVRNFLGALDHQHARGKGYFITTNVFTLQAEKFAEDKPIELVDGQKLIAYIRLSEKGVSKNVIQFET